MKRILRIVLCLALAAGVSLVCAGCPKQITPYFGTERTIWIGDGMMINTVEDDFATITLDGVTYECLLGYVSASFTLHSYEKGHSILWEFTSQLVGDKLTVTMTKDREFERGNSQVDHTGMKFVLYNVFKEPVEKE